MQGDGYDQVARSAERAVIMSIQIAARTTINAARFVFLLLRAALRRARKIPQMWRDAKATLDRYGDEDKRQELPGGERDESMEKLKGTLYGLLPDDVRRQVSFADFGQAFDRMITDGSRQQQQEATQERTAEAGHTEEAVHEQYVRHRWGADATFDNVWQQGLGAQWSQGPQSPEDAMVIWASATVSDVPAAAQARENAEQVLRAHEPDMMAHFDRNVQQGLSPWEAMSGAYQSAQAAQNSQTAQSTQNSQTAQSTQTGANTQGPTSGAESEQTRGQRETRTAGNTEQPKNEQPTSEQGRGAQTGQPRGLPPGPPISVREAVRSGPGTVSDQNSNRGSTTPSKVEKTTLG